MTKKEKLTEKSVELSKMISIQFVYWLFKVSKSCSDDGQWWVSKKDNTGRDIINLFETYLNDEASKSDYYL